MQRLDGFSWDDVTGMRDAGIDTSAVVRAAMVSFFEGAILFGVFHGDLHGGNLVVMPDGRVALFDYGITGRLNETRRLAFLRLLMGGSTNDLDVQIEALRDLGALPPDVDVKKLIVELGLDRPPVDPTQMDPEELMAQLRDVTKALLGYGARMPKELMLFVKNMLFLSSVIGTMASDVDLFAEITHISMYFAEKHGARIAAEVGIDPREYKPDLAGMKASMGIVDDRETITMRELEERRRIIRERMQHHRTATSRRGGLRERFGRK
jgi:ubiquinone biosynthesis protein